MSQNNSAFFPMVRHSSSSPDSKLMGVFDDGYVRVSFAKLLSIHFTHLISGLDEDSPDQGSGDVLPRTICGYTEWISDCDPKISIGWDWLMHERSQLRRVGEPRSNLMLHTNLRDVGPAQLPVFLCEFVDTLKWQSAVLNYIAVRYR